MDQSSNVYVHKYCGHSLDHRGLCELPGPKLSVTIITS